MALAELSVVEQWYRAVLMMESGVSVTEVARRFGVSRQSVSTWCGLYRTCPHQTIAEVEAVICELRLEHPRWEPRQLVHDLERGGEHLTFPNLRATNQPGVIKHPYSCRAAHLA